MTAPVSPVPTPDGERAGEVLSDLAADLRLAAECGIDGDGIFRWSRPLPDLLSLAARAIEDSPPASRPVSPGDPERSEGLAELLAVIIGDLWDYPPEGSPAPWSYRIHLAERYGADVADAWEQVGGGDGDRWVVRDAPKRFTPAAQGFSGSGDPT